MDLLTLSDKAASGVLYFGVYSFAGWLLEVCFRSITRGQFVNPGFLKGPFLPIYGSFSILIITAEPLLAHLTWGWHYTLFVVGSTILEYATGWYFLRNYHVQLWDYTKIPFNYQGLVALPFSLAWGALGLGFEGFLHPLVQGEIASIPLNFRIGLATLFAGYLVWDLYHSSKLLQQLEQFIDQFHELYEHLEQDEFEHVLAPFKRLLEAFPELSHTVNENMSAIRKKLSKLQEIVAQLKIMKHRF